MTPSKATDLDAVIKMVIQAERGAIGVYDALIKKTHQKDPVTYIPILHILEEEIAHEDDF